jgi:hypothetical protein
VVLGSVQLMRRVALATGLAAAVLAASVEIAATMPPRPAVPGFGFDMSASRVVDRTFSCRLQTFGGAGDLDIYVTPPRELPGAIPGAPSSHVPAHLIVYTGALKPDESLVVIRPRPSTQPGVLSNVAGGAAGVFVHTRRCTPASSSVGLTQRGLVGPPVVGYRELDCPVRGRVLVRVRSVLRSAVEWRRIVRPFAGVRQPLVETKVAVRFQKTGKPIAYAEHDAKAQTKLWFSSGCS